MRQVRDELGSDAEIIRAERIRTGGLAGFFAREHYEVVAKRQETAALASSEPDDGSSDADELVGSRAAETVPAQTPPPAQLPIPTGGGPSTVQPDKTASGSGRSIQAALLDRADRVSTEELLVRVAETHSAEWGTESFQSILGRAMLDAVGPSVDKAVSPSVEQSVSPSVSQVVAPSVDETVSPSADTVSIEERRRKPSPVDSDPVPSAGTVSGLRLDPIRPGENVIDPASQPPVDDPALRPQGEDPVSASPLDGHVPVPGSDGGPPFWGQPWMPGWAPWMTNCWPAHAAGSASGAAPHLLCTKCADSLCADDVDGGPASSTLDKSSTSVRDDGVSWSDLRHEIDDVRRRLDDIMGAIPDVTDDGDRHGGRAPAEAESDDDLEPASDPYRFDR